MTDTAPRSHRGAIGAGLSMAVLSAFTFGSSGPMAKSLLETGWSAGAAVLVRLGGAAVVLGVLAAVTLRGRWRLTAPAARTLGLYGLVAMAGTQLAFFNAVRTLDVGVALLLEFLAPVLLLVWSSLRARTWPALPTTLGAVTTIIGLAFVLELRSATRVDPVGVVWGLVAAVCLAGFFVLSDRRDDEGLPPLVMAAGGTVVGAVVIGLAGVIGVVPLTFATVPVELAGADTSWLVPAAWLVLVSTAAAYLTGIGAVLRLGARTASFVALSEVLFAVLLAWVLLAELPGGWQLVGGVCIVAGIVVIQRHERPRRLEPPPATLEAVHPV